VRSRRGGAGNQIGDPLAVGSVTLIARIREGLEVFIAHPPGERPSVEPHAPGLGLILIGARGGGAVGFADDHHRLGKRALAREVRGFKGLVVGIGDQPAAERGFARVVRRLFEGFGAGLPDAGQMAVVQAVGFLGIRLLIVDGGWRGDAAVRAEGFLEFADRQHQGEAGVGLRLGLGGSLPGATQRDRGQRQQANGHHREQDQQ